MSVTQPRPKTAYPLAPLLAVAAAIVLSLFSVLDTYQSVSAYAASTTDPHGIRTQEEMFREAARLLPPAGVVGYLADLPGSGPGSAAFFGAQYVLAPRLLVDVPGKERPEWVVARFLKPAGYQSAGRKHGLVLVKDFGGGVAVYRREQGQP